MSFLSKHILIPLLFLIVIAFPCQGQAQTVRKAQVERLVVQAMTKSFLGYHEEAVVIYKKALEMEPTSSVINSAISDEYEALDDLLTAVHYATQAKELSPDNSHFYHLLANLYVQQNDYAAAEQVLNELITRFPEDLEALEELAYLQYTNDQFEDAQDSYERLESRLGPQQHISYRLLQIHYELNNVDGMEKALLKLQTLNPENTSIRRNLADLYTQHNRTEDAIHILEDALAADSTDVETVVSLAKLYEQGGNEAKAEALWARAMQTTGSPEDAYSKASHLYTRASEHPETLDVIIKLLEYAVERDPTFTEALILLGNIRFEEQAYEDAGILLYKAVQINPRNPEVWLQAAAAYLQIDEPKRAADIADEGLLLFPGQSSLLRVAAYGYMDSYRNDQSIQRFEEFYELLENDQGQRRELAEILSALGLLYSRKKDYQASDNAYEKALSLSSENVTVLNNLAYSLAERAYKLDRALTYARKAVTIDANNPSYMDTLAWVYFKRAELGKAEEWISKAIDVGGTTAIIYEHLGDIQFTQGKSQAAVEAWNKALKLNPDNELLAEKIKNNAD